MSVSGGSSPFLETPLEATSDKGIHLEDSPVRVGKNNHVDTIEAKDRQIISLEYKLNTLQNEFELERLQTQRQCNTLDKQYRSAVDELEKALDDTKFLHESNSKLQEELSVVKDQLNSTELEKDKIINGLQFKIRAIEQELSDSRLNQDSERSKLTNEVETCKIENENSQALLAKYEEELQKQSSELKNLIKSNNEKDIEISELKTTKIVNSHPNYSTEDLQELATMNRMFQDQMKYVKELEEANIKQANELKRLRNLNDSSQFWKSENEKLQSKLQDLEILENNIQELQVENIDLKSKLTSMNIFDDQNDKPENIINDWQLTKKENLILTDENSKLKLSVNNLKLLNEELAMERNQLLDLNKNYESSLINLKKLNHELDQQRLLSFEECKLLRKQLDDVNEVVTSDNEGRTKEMQSHKELETLIDDYKNKTDDLTNELKHINEQLLNSQKEQQNQLTKKRKTNDYNGLSYYSQRMNELQLENVELKRNLQKYQNLNKLLEEKTKKLISLKEKKIRILQLRDNPLANDQFIKKKQITLLQNENKDLMEQIKDSASDVRTVPFSVYESLSFELKQQENEIFKVNKKSVRLKEMFNKKSLEFIDVVNSILGFRLEFQQDNKVKIYSCFKPDKFLVVDLVKNTLVSNLNLHNWDELLKLWIEERGQIPCFLATVTLQLWEQLNSEKNVELTSI
ncbi:hypothetical protein KAFR_0C02150 [Kazachstania africana CBS 2517]|uniref:Spindle assembly checkpoint component MAD1 n=1 Tax=Kazachstania africana (strain ATCC 22294 / BCRC 22015 / CBS 2517 / CECT 1963 / NBRC 1671 / NRRL Y-8276) TaxID=1071382 RepID=H2AS58_KAZAF|nr:hypothetical protein KAFR_0C02150 [Kazachstania africana CBS 2517]CCF57208.1 hypothetical protein KAFR_0C02150 [Kazachstania africana CBS 2517]